MRPSPRPFVSFNHREVDPILSINVLFTDLTRINAFLRQRLDDFSQCTTPLEVRLAINSNDVPLSVIEATLNGYRIPIHVTWTGWNNIPAARNLLAAQSRGTYLVVCDDDCRISSGGIDFMLETLCEFPVGVVGLQSISSTGERFKPRSWEPTIRHPELFGDLTLVAGVHGMAFATYRELLTRLPLSEVRTLRGEWIDWFTRLWRAGIASAYAIDDRYYITDQFIPGGSATRYSDRLKYVLISLMCLAYEYTLSDWSTRMLCEHYLAPNLPDNDAQVTKRIFTNIVQMAARDFQCNCAALDAYSPFTRNCLYEAAKHCREHIGELASFRTQIILPNTQFDIGPFGLFDPAVTDQLQRALSRARDNLNRYICKAAVSPT